MPTTTTKTRQALKARFVRGAIPTEADFGDLISAGLNQADDGLFKLPNEPLSLVRQKPDQPVLRLYDDGSAAGSSWQIGLSSDKAAGLCISNKDGKTSLFLDQASGSVGIGTGSPFACLTVHSDLSVGFNTKDPLSSLSYGGHLAIRSPSPQLDFIDTDSDEADWAIHVNQGNMWFLRSPWNDQGLILCSDGNVGVGTTTPQAKLHVNGDAKFASVIADSLTVAGKKMDGGGSFGDHITVSENGSVGIGTDSPCAKLTIHSGLGVSQTIKDPDSQLTYGGHLAIRSPSPQLDFIDTDSDEADWAIHVNQGNMWFLRSPWNDQGLILGENGVVGIGSSSEGRLRIGKHCINSHSDGWLRLYERFGDSSLNAWGKLGVAAYKFYSCGGIWESSDLRLKVPESIRSISNSTEILSNLNPVGFKFKNNPDDSLQVYGFIAQEVRKCLPEAVEEGPDGILGIKNSCLVAVLAMALKEQQVKIDGLQAQISRLT